jgi:hypothetical protein
VRPAHQGSIDSNRQNDTLRAAAEVLTV